MLALVVSACGTEASGSGDFPTIAPTETARPHATATFIPQESVSALPEVDWNNVSHMYGAMRPDYTGDVDQFIEGNRYYIDVTLDLGPEAAVISGAQRVRYTNTNEVTLDEVVYRLYPNLADMGGRLRIFNVTLDGEPIEPIYEVRNSVMSIPIEGGLAPGESAEMTMDFIMTVERGINPERFGFEHDQFQAVNWHPTLSVYEGPEKGWWKTRIFTQNNDPYYGAPGLYEIFITHDPDTIIGMSGVTIDTVENEDGTITEHVVTGPMRDNFILAGTTMGKITDEVEGTTVNVYFLPGGERGAEWVMEVSLRSIEVFNDLFGDYPYSEMDVGQTYIAAGGVEYPGIFVVVQSNWNNGSPATENVTAHEAAHQWWYAMVGNNQGETPWLDESLTTYSAAMYLREAYDDNDERYINTIQGQQNTFNFFLGSGAQNLTMHRPTVEFPPFQVGILVYVKGSLFYHELEQMIGREAFEQGVWNYFHDMKL